MLKRALWIFFLTVCFSAVCNAQIEGAYVKVKDFKAFGFGSFLNLGFPVSEANYLTIEGGFKYFKNSDGESMGIFPVLLGYRYTLDQSGSGFYIEPYAGYTFGGTDIAVYDEYSSPVIDANGNFIYLKIAGPSAGMGIGYLFQPMGKVQFNLALRYDHGFGNSAINMVGLRLTHSFGFGRQNGD
jgi:Autotransporter beta-domain